MSAFHRQRQIDKVKHRKKLINVPSAKFGNEAHFMCFADIVASRNARIEKLHRFCHSGAFYTQMCSRKMFVRKS